MHTWLAAATAAEPAGFLLDHVADAVIAVDAEWNIRYWNQAATTIYGWHRDEVVGRSIAPVLDVVRYLDGSTFEEVLAETYERGMWRGEVVQRHRDGRELIIEAATHLLHDTAGSVIGMVAVNRDVGGRASAEEQLRASEANLRAVFNNTAQSFVLLDRDSRVVLWNSLAHERTLAVTGKALVVGACILEYGAPGLVEPMRASLARVVAGEAVHIEYSVGTAERPLWLSFDYIPVRDAAGQVIGSCITTLDITVQRVALEAVTRSEERFRALVAETSDPIVLLGPDLLLRYASPAWERVLGYPPDSWLGRSPFELIHPDDRPLADDATRAMLCGEPAPRQVTLRLMHRDGSWVWVEVVGTDLRAHPAVEGVVLTLRDVTERKRLTAQLLQAQKMESIGRLAGGVAHDFNNLLTALTGYIELALDGIPPDVPARADIVEARKVAERAAGLTRQLLAFARRQAFAPQACALNDLIAEMDRMLRRLIGADIALATTLDPDAGVVMADPGQIEQVIVNLAVNARDAMPGGGTLKIETAHLRLDAQAAGRLPDLRPGDYVRITVSDTGVGMDEQVRERIFEPFFTTKGQARGTGLGLATCYGIVKQHGGAIDVISQPGAGSTFQIYLPQAQAPRPRTAEPQAPPPLDGSETVLIVEDDAAVRALTARILRDHGYTVLEAGDGEEALQAIAAHEPIHLVLSDMVMPRLGGGELVARLRAERPGLAVVCMSGYVSDAGTPAGLRDLRVRLIHKPFTSATLLRVVRETLDAAGLPPGRRPSARQLDLG